MNEAILPEVRYVMMSFTTASDQIVSTSQSLQNAGVIIPTCNAAGYWNRLHAGLSAQGLAPHQVLIVDSSSTDGTQILAQEAGYHVLEISREDFRHGATRQMAAGFFPKQDVLIFLTQDALPSSEERCFESLVQAFENPEVGAAYGRQLARESAGPIESHARLFNYPDRSESRGFESRAQIGFRAAFFSNSFAAYRRSAFDQVGGFPAHVIMAEDVTVAARLLLAGWKIAYQADACVAHSHDLSFWQEFARYFDIGVYHGHSSWLFEQFGTAGGEGRAFIQSQLRFLWQTAPTQLPVAMGRNLGKWLSYHLGLHERWIPLHIKRGISGQRNYWLDETTEEEQNAKLYQPKLSS